MDQQSLVACEICQKGFPAKDLSLCRKCSRLVCETCRDFSSCRKCQRSEKWRELREMLVAAEEYESSMYLHIDDDSEVVELVSDTTIPTYSKWLPGFHGDMGLILNSNTDEVVGVRIRLRNPRLVVQYDGPIKINEGFLKEPSGESEHGLPSP